jgi:hypothetical protein
MPDHLRVRRTGGFAGRTVEGSLDLTGSDDRVTEASALLDRVDLDSLPAGKPWPDMYVFWFELDGVEARPVSEHLLTPDLRRLADLVLDQTR